MKRNHYLILGGIALIGGYLWYKNNKDKKAKAPPTGARKLNSKNVKETKNRGSFLSNLLFKVLF